MRGAALQPFAVPAGG